MADHAYTDISLNGDFSDDGEYFLVTMDLNGVPIRFGTVYVGDQRSSFQAAAAAGQAKAAEPAPPAQA